MPRYDDYSREELLCLLEARDRRDITRFGLVWETNEVERDKVSRAMGFLLGLWLLLGSRLACGRVMLRLAAYALAALHWAEDAEGALCYVPQVKAATAREILKRVEPVPGVIVYTRQTALLSPRLAEAEHIQVETIPQSLPLKFGLRRGR